LGAQQQLFDNVESIQGEKKATPSVPQNKAFWQAVFSLPKHLLLWDGGNIS
jgi:hypothetical protein